MNGKITIMAATSRDAGLVLHFIRWLAEYERLEHLVSATEEGLRESLFGERPGAEVLIACTEDEPVGVAVFFPNFSTFLGRRGMWLEDIFVESVARGRGVGKLLLLAVARIAHERGCGRFEWAALDWNAPAWDFYRALGAAPLEDWTMFRLTGSALERLARM
ncbi:MAG: GNAT family N-acetyltransferase [Burkholderiales bacterium]|nr:GNAT family N-acetyltransferase [Burkholderiales bacterium]